MLGRLIRQRMEDMHYAEGVFILAFTALAIAVTLANYLGWALLQPLLTGPGAEDLQLYFALGQLSLAGLFALFCMLGFKPALFVTFDPTLGLTIEQGDKTLHLPPQSIQATSQISALRFHQHYRKYKKTASYFVRLPESLLLLTTDQGPVVLGLNTADQQELMDQLQPQSEKIVFSPLTV